MAREKKITVYTFNELSSKAKDVARDWYRQGALDDEWWGSIYEDAAQVGVKITGFDADGGNSIEGELVQNAERCAKVILKEHGPTTDTYKLAQDFLHERQDLQAKLDAAEDEDYRVGQKIENSIDELEEEFKRALLEEYLSLLKQDIEYHMSDESVDAMIRANEYEFLASGKRA